MWPKNFKSSPCRHVSRSHCRSHAARDKGLRFPDPWADLESRTPIMVPHATIG